MGMTADVAATSDAVLPPAEEQVPSAILATVTRELIRR